MKNLNGYPILLLTLSAAMSCHAQPVAQLWSSMQAKLSSNKPLLAYEIDSTFEIPGDSGRESGKYKEIFTSVPMDDKPRRSISEKSAHSDTGIKYSELDLGLTDNFANHPEQLFSIVDSMEVEGKEKIDGEMYSIVKLRTHHPKGNFPIAASVWISEKDSRPLRVRGIYEKTPIPGMKSLNFSVDYTTDATGRSLPMEVSIAYTISIFFHTGEFAFSHRLTDWRTRSTSP